MSLKRRFGYILTGSVGLTLVNILALPFFTRILGPIGFSTYAFIFAAIALVMRLGSFGLFDGMRKQLSSEQKRAPILRFFFKTGGFLGIASALVLFFALAFLPFQTASDSLLLQALAAANLFGRYILELTRAALMGLNKEHISEPLRGGRRLLELCLAVPLAIPFGISGVLLGFSIACGIAVVISLVYIRRSITFSKIISADASLLDRREILTDNLMIFSHGLLTISHRNIDILLIGTFIGGTATGVYKAALAIAELLWQAATAAQTALIYGISDLWDAGRVDQISTRIERAFRLNGLLVILLSTGLYGLADVFLPLYYGTGYSESVWPLKVLIPGAMAYAAARIVIGAEFGRANPRAPVIASVGPVTLNIILNLVMIPRYGVAGAAVATSISYGLMLVTHLASSYYVGLSLTGPRSGRAVVAGLLGAIGVLTLANYTHGIQAMVIVPLVGGLLFIAISFVLGGVSRTEISF